MDLNHSEVTYQAAHFLKHFLPGKKYLTDWSHYLLMFKSPAGFFELVLVLRAVALKPTDEAV